MLFLCETESLAGSGILTLEQKMCYAGIENYYILMT